MRCERTGRGIWPRGMSAGGRELFRRLKARIGRGMTITFGRYRVRLSIERARKAPLPSALPQVPRIEVNAVAYLERRFPALRAYGLVASPDDAAALLAFYNDHLPSFYPPAQGAALRSQLQKLKDRATQPALRHSAARAIAASDLAEGLPERAQMLADDPVHSAALIRESAAFEKSYGAALVSETWTHATRGASLLYYLRHHGELVRGKTVLHIAPEAEPRSWIRAVADRYVTLDAHRPDVEVIADITSTGLADDSFDTIFCHRVLEHVVDDTAALRELHRLLRQGGVLNMSVPQAIHREQTAEWLVPDASHHSHVRHYGRDLAQRLEAAGFVVELEPWLLQCARQELIAHGAFPMRMYNLRKT